MKKLLLIGAITGFLMAFSIGIVWNLICSHGLCDTAAARLFAPLILCPWPAVVLMIDVDRLDSRSLWLFITSCVANGLVYAAVFSLFAFVRKKLSRVLASPR